MSDNVFIPKDFTKGVREVSGAGRAIGGVFNATTGIFRGAYRTIASWIGLDGADDRGRGNVHRDEAYENRQEYSALKSDARLQDFSAHNEAYPPELHGNRWGRIHNQRDANIENQYFKPSQQGRYQQNYDPYTAPTANPANVFLQNYESNGKGLDDTYAFASPPPFRATVDAARNLPEIQNYFAARGQDASDASRAEVLHAWQDIVFDERLNPGLRQRGMSPSELETALGQRLSDYHGRQYAQQQQVTPEIVGDVPVYDPRSAHNQRQSAQTYALRETPEQGIQHEATPVAAPVALKPIEPINKIIHEDQLELQLHKAGFAQGAMDGKVSKEEITAMANAVDAYNKTNPGQKLSYEYGELELGGNKIFNVNSNLAQFIANKADNAPQR